MIMIKPSVLSRSDSFKGLTLGAAASLCAACWHTFSHTRAATQSQHLDDFIIAAFVCFVYKPCDCQRRFTYKLLTGM